MNTNFADLTRALRRRWSSGRGVVPGARPVPDPAPRPPVRRVMIESALRHDGWSR